MPVAPGVITIQLFMPKVENRGGVITSTNKAPLIDGADSEL